MSRIGRKPIPLPKGVTVNVALGALTVKGPKGSLQAPLPPGISAEVKGTELIYARAEDNRQQRAFHGLARALGSNAIKGVTDGFTKEMDIVGVGYRAQSEGKNKIVFALGYSHPVEYIIQEGVTVTVDKQTHLVVTGIDRQKVGQVAAEIHDLRPPDPYKQKGIRYVGEVLKKKAGKAGATGSK
ncbi:MAG: 50S ribosomal protein L6 [Vicinamibacteria bacterium]|nr:50S ribosomal protein L6 [Vicinamibacteria bacterium]